MYPIEKYKFFTTGNKVIAVSTYAGKTVRGVALCHPDDEFDLEFGKKLAAARCNAKIAKKRYMRSSKKFYEAYDEFEAARNKAIDMQNYNNDAWREFCEAQDYLYNLGGEIAE